MNTLISGLMYLSFNFRPQRLNVIEDAIDKIDEHFRDNMADAVVYIIKQMVELLTGGLSTSSSGVGGTVHDLMIYHPKNYMSGNVWNNIVGISTDIIVPIATTIIAIIAVYDLYQMVVVGNGMHDFNSSFFVRWVIKTHIAITLTSSAFDIASWIFGLGSKITFYTNDWVVDLITNVDTADTLKTNLMQYHIGKLIITLILAVITLVAVFFMFAAIVIGLMGRMIEIYMYLSVAPMTLATLMNNETKGVGDSWVRGALGLSFQVFFVIIALTVFGSIFQTTIDSVAGGSNIIWNFVKLCAYSITLIITILRSGQISKGMFGAH